VQRDPTDQDDDAKTHEGGDRFHAKWLFPAGCVQSNANDQQHAEKHEDRNECFQAIAF
jgi:hypothetical protein